MQGHAARNQAAKRQLYAAYGVWPRPNSFDSLPFWTMDKIARRMKLDWKTSFGRPYEFVETTEWVLMRPLITTPNDFFFCLRSCQKKFSVRGVNINLLHHMPMMDLFQVSHLRREFLDQPAQGDRMLRKILASEHTNGIQVTTVGIGAAPLLPISMITGVTGYETKAGPNNKRNSKLRTLWRRNYEDIHYHGPCVTGTGKDAEGWFCWTCRQENHWHDLSCKSCSHGQDDIPAEVLASIYPAAHEQILANLSTEEANKFKPIEFNPLLARQTLVPLMMEMWEQVLLILLMGEFERNYAVRDV